MNAKIKHVSLSPDIGGTSVCLMYENHTKLQVTIPTPPPGAPVFVKDILTAIEKALYLPEGTLAQNGTLHDEFAKQFVAVTYGAASENFTLTPVKS